MHRRVSPRIWSTTITQATDQTPATESARRITEKRQRRDTATRKTHSQRHAWGSDSVRISLAGIGLFALLLLMWGLNTSLVNAQSADTPIDPAILRALTTQAESTGTARVIVQLDTNFAPFGQLSFIGAFAQAWQI
ncbi:MAG: hypothetical protein KDE19_00875, partial [Caldilineaceae bacterium]|nr:hypothetical protein [Caldilineaceae bacterium]